MFKALDKDGNVTSASDAVKGEKYYCQDCDQEVTLKKGTIRKHHFAHTEENENCRYEKDKDYKTAWHIHMQDFFPIENQEVRFLDEEKNEVHIADVFVPEEIVLPNGERFSGTVIEFQHSPIDQKEFFSRTAFHISHCHRIVWVFDESSKSEDNTMGRFRLLGILNAGEKRYKWMFRPRRILKDGPPLKSYFPVYSVCVYTGSEGDLLHRIVYEDFGFEEVLFSATDINMQKDMDTGCFFEYDQYWVREDDARARIAEKQQILSQIQQAARNAAINRMFQNIPYKRRRRF